MYDAVKFFIELVEENDLSKMRENFLTETQEDKLKEIYIDTDKEIRTKQMLNEDGEPEDSIIYFKDTLRSKLLTEFTKSKRLINNIYLELNEIDFGNCVIKYRKLLQTVLVKGRNDLLFRKYGFVEEVLEKLIQYLEEKYSIQPDQITAPIYLDLSQEQLAYIMGKFSIILKENNWLPMQPGKRRKPEEGENTISNISRVLCRIMRIKDQKDNYTQPNFDSLNTAFLPSNNDSSSQFRKKVDKILICK